MGKIWNCLFTGKVNCCYRCELYIGIFGIIIAIYATLIYFGLVMDLIGVRNSNIFTGTCNQKYNTMCHNNQLVCSINNWPNFLLGCPIWGIPGDFLLFSIYLLKIMVI